MVGKIVSWFGFVLGLSSCFGRYEDDSVVETQYGPIQGRVSALGRAFTSIPYAAPPVDYLRWQNPQAPISWTDTLDTTQDAPGCAQVCVLLPSFACPNEISEDCLYLNVFTPPTTSNIGDNATASEWSVMVFIHGGSYDVGYSGGWLYNGTNLAYINNVIVVTINYRLGVLGSLYDPTNDISGNFGYLDQKFAIEWVYNNIAKFGGNPKSITIFGESAGASSVSLHLIDTDNVKNGPKFVGAIMESNPIGLRLRTPEDWDGIREDFYSYLKCSNRTCLLEKKMDDILASQTECNVNRRNNGNRNGIDMLWTPTIITTAVDSSSLLTEQPLIAFQNGNFVGNKWDVNIINGVNNNETQMFTSQNMTESDYNRDIDHFFRSSNDAEKVKSEYREMLNYESYTNTYSILSTDASFKCPNHNATAAMAAYANKHNNIYFYHFDGSASFGQYVLPSAVSQCWNLPCHETELPFVFRPNFGGLVYKGDENHEAQWTQPELAFANGMQIFWGNFAKNGETGKQTINGQTVEWVTYDSNSHYESSVVFRVNSTAMMQNYDDDYCAFWNSLGYNWLY